MRSARGTEHRGVCTGVDVGSSARGEVRAQLGGHGGRSEESVQVGLRYLVAKLGRRGNPGSRRRRHFGITGRQRLTHPSGGRHYSTIAHQIDV